MQYSLLLSCLRPSLAPLTAKYFAADNKKPSEGNTFKSGLESLGEKLMHGQDIGGDKKETLWEKSKEMFTGESKSAPISPKEGTVKDRGSTNIPAEGKANVLREKLFGRATGDDEIKYPIRFSDEEQMGPLRKTIESHTDVSEKIHEGIGMVKQKLHEAVGNVERKEQVK